MSQSLISTDFMLKEQLDDRVEQITAKIDQLVNHDQVGIQQVYLHMNAASDQTGAEDFIRGAMVVMDAETKLDASFLHQNMFGQVMAFPVKKLDDNGNEVPIDVSDFESFDSRAIDEMSHAVPQELTSRTASLPSMRCMASVNSVEDGDEWQSVLGKNGRVGLYRVERAYDEYDYSLVVHVDQTEAAKQLYQWVYSLDEDESMTLAEFVRSPRYKFVRSLNKRNAQRLGAKAAKALGLHVETAHDLDAYRSDPHKVYPELAIPSVWNEYNVFQSGKWAKRPAYFLYDSTVCTKRAQGGLILLDGDARSPVHVFPPAKVEAASASDGVTSNEAGFSFPLTLGQVQPLEHFLTHMQSARSVLSQRQRQLVNRRVTWEGKERKATEWFHHGVVDQLYLHYNARDEDQARLFSRLYKDGDLSNVQTLKPVIVKISTEEYPGYDV